MMTIRDVMDKFMDFPLEKHDTILVRVSLFDNETDEIWSQEQLDLLNAGFELTLLDPEEE